MLRGVAGTPVYLGFQSTTNCSEIIYGVVHQTRKINLPQKIGLLILYAKMFNMLKWYPYKSFNIC